MIHLAKNYGLGRGLRCTRSPFTKGRIADVEEFEKELAERPQFVCKRCIAMLRRDAERKTESDRAMQMLFGKEAK